METNKLLLQRIVQMIEKLDSRMSNMEDKMLKLENTVKIGFKKNHLEHNQIIGFFDKRYLELKNKSYHS
jgi:hypothetical protein